MRLINVEAKVTAIIVSGVLAIFLEFNERQPQLFGVDSD
jgi:hypothetical protein